MTTLKFFILHLLAIVFARPVGFSTANAAAEKPPEAPPPKGAAELMQRQLDAQAAEIAELRKQLSSQQAAPPEEDNSLLAMLAKGAGVPLSDVRWRVQSGLDPEQAVAAAVAQKEHDAAKKATARKGGK